MHNINCDRKHEWSAFTITSYLQRKTERCLPPKARDDKRFLFSYNEEYWSNNKQALQLIEGILLPYIERITHMWRRWDAPEWWWIYQLLSIITREFLFGIYWWTWKTNNYLKNCWSGPIKNKIILIFTMLHFLLKKIKKNICRYHYQNLDDMICSSWDIEKNILKLVILGQFLPFYIPPKNPQNKKFEKWKNFLEISSFIHVYQKSQSYDVRFLRYRVR